MKYLSAEEILAIHFEVIEATGGRHGLREIGLLKSIAEKPKTGSFGREFYADVFSKAAVFLEALVNYHVFIDGNKRTGVVATARFLFVNGYELVCSNEELEDFVLKIAVKKIKIKEIAIWLEKHSKKIKAK